MRSFFSRRDFTQTSVDPPRSNAMAGLWSTGFGLLASRALQIIIVLALSAIVVLGLKQLTTVVIPILLALIFASAFAPVMRWLRSRGVPAALATVLVLLGIIALLSAVGWLIVWAVLSQWDVLAAQARNGFEQALAWAGSLPFIESKEQLLALANKQLQAGAKFLSTPQFSNGALAGAGAVTGFVTGLVLMVVVLFFFLKDGPQIWRFMLRPFSGEKLARAERAGNKVVETLGSYIRGTAAVAAVDAVGILIGLLIMRIPLAIPLAVLVFMLAFIPLVGAIVAGALAALVALVTHGPMSALVVIIVVVLVNQLEGNLLQPVLMGRALKLHALVILLSLTVGTVLAGILGAILAVPIVAVVWGIVKVWDGPALAARPFRERADH